MSEFNQIFIRKTFGPEDAQGALIGANRVHGLHGLFYRKVFEEMVFRHGVHAIEPSVQRKDGEEVVVDRRILEDIGQERVISCRRRFAKIFPRAMKEA